MPFGIADEEESQTILTVQFAIGPVPMVLEIDAFADYGVSGDLDVGLQFPNVLDSQSLNKVSPIAKAGATQMPHASAGLSAFVGAGFDEAEVPQLRSESKVP